MHTINKKLDVLPVTELQALVLPLLMFTMLATATPGPNNILLTLSGSQYGYLKSLPFIIGIRLGIGLLFILMGAGIGTVVVSHPNWYFSLKVLGASYLIYLALKIGLSGPSQQHQQSASLINLKQAVLMQFINPKALMMVLSCITAFSLPGDLYVWSVLQACLIFSLVGLISNSCWVLFGVAINKVLSTEKTQQRFNQLLAILTLCAVVLLF